MLAVTALTIAACGSSSSSKSTSGSTTSSSSSGKSLASAADPTKVYAPGVPTLEELYKGTEGTPPASGPPAKKGASVIFVSCGQESPGCAAPPDEFAGAAKVLGWNYKILNGKLDVDNYYDTAFREAIAAKPSAIVSEGIGCSEVTQPLREAKAAGIPVLGIEGVDCNDPKVGGKEALQPIPFYYNDTAKNTAQWYEQFGANQANYLIDATQGKAKVIRTEFLGTFGIYQAEAQARQFKKCAECEILATLPFESSEQEPNGPLFQKFTTDLVKYTNANAILMTFDTDEVTAGLAKAVVDSGRKNELVVGGGETDAAGASLVREENGVDGEGGSHDVRWLSWAAADEVNRFLSHQPPVGEGLGFVVVDKNHNLPAPGQNYKTKVPYQEAYEKIWTGK
jgi:ribose transport system substrate-binding protein